MKKKRTRIATKIITGYVDHNIACKLVAEQRGIDVSKVEKTVQNFFLSGICRNLAAHYPMKIKNFALIKPSVETMHALRLRIKKGKLAFRLRMRKIREKRKERK